jgi:putative phage-type endonuclease
VLTTEQQSIRNTGIGASEIAAIVGLSPHENALDVYMRKVGRAATRPDTPHTRWGRLLESVIADRYAEEYGVDLVESTTVRHPEHDWMVATPDRVWRDGSRLVEIKNVSARSAREWGEPWTSQIPERYFLQVLWQMAVTGTESADVVALIGGHDLRVYTTERDAQVEAWLVDAGREFWEEHVLAQVEPAVEDWEATARYLSLRYPRDNGETVMASPEIEAWLARLREAREIIEQADASRLQAEVKIKEFMGEASTLVGLNGRVSYRAPKDAAVVDWRAAAIASGASREVVESHTTTRPGTRRFLARFD